MKKIVVLFILVFLLCSCDSEKKMEVKKVSCIEMKELLANGALLIDVRSEEEYKGYHLDEAVNYPYEMIAEEISSISKDREIIVYCQSGRRSAIAAQTLLDLGYTNVYDLGAIGNCQ